MTCESWMLFAEVRGLDPETARRQWVEAQPFLSQANEKELDAAFERALQATTRMRELLQ